MSQGNQIYGHTAGEEIVHFHVTSWGNSEVPSLIRLHAESADGHLCIQLSIIRMDTQ